MKKAPGTGDYRATEAMNRRLQGNRGQEQEATGEQRAGQEALRAAEGRNSGLPSREQKLDATREQREGGAEGKNKVT